MGIVIHIQAHNKVKIVLRGVFPIPENIYTVLKDTIKSNDFVQSVHTIHDKRIHFTYYKAIVDQELLHHELLHRIQISEAEINHLFALKNLIPLENIKLSSNVDEISQSLVKGFIFVQLEPDLNEGLLIPIADLKRGYRSNNEAENEYSVICPKVGFVEDIDTNLNLLRKELISENLRFEEYIVGSLSQTRVTIVYVDGVCNPQHVNTVRQRIVDAESDVLFDKS